MSLTPIVHSNIAVELMSSPIESSWIHEGNPTARKAILSRSEDRTAVTLVWDCTPGKFEWHYDVDETIHILEGSIVLDDRTGPARRLGPGDVVFFPRGAVVDWTVETHVRKLAFFRRTVPMPFAVAIIVMGKAGQTIRRMMATKAGKTDVGAAVALDGIATR